MRTTTLTILGALTFGCGGESAPGIPAGEGGSDLPPVAAPYADRSQALEQIGVSVDSEDLAASRFVFQWAAPDVLDEEAPPTLEYTAPGVTEVEDFGIEPTTPREGENSAGDPQDRLYAAGEICTYTAAEWGSDCTGDPESAGCLREYSFSESYPEGITLGQGDKRFHLSSAKAVARALPGSGIAEVLTVDQTDPPATQANRLATELAALHLNIAYSRRGMVGTSDIESAVTLVGPLAGFTVIHIAEMAEGVLSGESYHGLGVHLNPEAFADEVAALNAAAPGCVADDFIARSL